MYRYQLPRVQSIRKMHIEAYKMRWGSGDNYCYVLSDDGTSDSWVIDATEPEK